MKTPYRAVGALTLVMLVVSCSGLLKKGGDDAGEGGAVAADTAEASAPTAAPTAAAIASNEGDVARFPDEAAIANEVTPLKQSYNVREAPPAGKVIGGLTKGTSVTKIASRAGYFLITFDKPGEPGTKQMGWIHRDAFSAVIPDAGPLVCPTGEIALFGDTPFCGRVCQNDSVCPAGQACKGQANKLLPTGKAGDGVTVCTVFRGPTPPPPAVVDAGHPVVVDAGRAPDAAPPPPPPTGTGDVIAAGAGNACATGYVYVKKTGKCHRPCPGGPTGSDCKNNPHFCIKCDVDQKKVCAESQTQCR